MCISNDGEWLRTNFVEATMNQMVSQYFCKRHPMQRTEREVDLKLQGRMKTLDQELSVVFRRWYLNLQHEGKPREAYSPDSCCPRPQPTLRGVHFQTIRRKGDTSYKTFPDVIFSAGVLQRLSTWG